MNRTKKTGEAIIRALIVTVLCILVRLCLAGAFTAEKPTSGKEPILQGNWDSLEVELLQKEAAQGNTEAQISLGMAYDKGKGVEQSDESALYWYRKAAEQGDDAAQFYLGRMYENGQGVEQSDEQAFYWFSKAAEQGHAEAQTALGIAYSSGQGVE